MKEVSFTRKRCYSKNKTFKVYVYSHEHTPVLSPSVSIHAPVLSAAVMSPKLKAWHTRGDRGKLSVPPCTEITNLGISMCHSLSISWTRSSGGVLQERRTYCRENITLLYELCTILYIINTLLIGINTFA